MFLVHNCSVKEKVEFKREKNVLEEVGKFCYPGDISSLYGGASDMVSARKVSSWKKARGLGGALFGKQGLSLKQHLKIFCQTGFFVLWAKFGTYHCRWVEVARNGTIYG